MIFFKDGKIAKSGTFKEIATKNFLLDIYGADISTFMQEKLDIWKNI